MPRPVRAESRTRSAAGAPPLHANVADLRALAHPLRLRILELVAEAPRTTKQVADLLGQPPTRLYHHVAALERAGLLVLKETRQNRGAVEKWYEAVSRQMGTPPQGGPKGRAGKSARRAVAVTALEQARQEMMAAVPRPGEEPALLVRLVAAGPPKVIAEIRQRLYRTVQDVQREYHCDESAVRGAGDDYERWAITMAFAPVWPRPKRQRRRSGRPQRQSD